MSRVDRLLGLARSLAIYHAIAGRQRRLRRLYAGFVRPGDLVFEIGAHAGNRVRAFAALGCRIVALEPQPDFARVLRTIFGRTAGVTIVESAVSDRPGRGTLSLSERTPTVTTLDARWRDARANDPDFSRVRWNRQIEVQQTTLDLLISRFGAPRFVKIDCEGSEAPILRGLSHAVPALSFEYLPRAMPEADACIALLAALGPYEFNWSVGESSRLASERWLDAREIAGALRTPPAQRRPGDVYVRLANRDRRGAA